MQSIKLKVILEGQANSCFFRSTVVAPYRKALIKITDRCDLRCAHCFVSATERGDDMTLDQVQTRLIPQLVEARVVSVTITGGEPFAHPQLIEISRAFCDAKLSVTICTNGTHMEDHEIEQFKAMGVVQFNVSLDGFSAESHGKFRGNKASFDVTVNNARRLASHGLLKGILATPNLLAKPEEYSAICAFAKEVGAKFVLMNPLSSYGRGIKSKKTLATDRAFMEQVRATTDSFRDDLDIVPIRFPNRDLPLAACIAGNIIYVFPKGDVTVCPYLVFATENLQSRYSRADFIVGNAFGDSDVAARLDAYNLEDRYHPGDNPTCGECDIAGNCGKGCPAAVVAAGGKLGDVDREVCPKTAVLE